MQSVDTSSRYVIVTGGGGGAGQTVCRRWRDAGASVLLVGSSRGSVDAAVAQIGGERITGFVADLTTAAGADEMAARAVAVFGRPADTLIHLVGGFGMAAVSAPDAPAVWDRMISLNLTSAFHCFRAVLPGLRDNRRGWIVTLASRAALAPGANASAYAASKAALIALSLSLAAETRDEAINVNVIAASTIDTPANRKAMPKANWRDWVTPDEIASTTLFLCSESASAISGDVIEVYGRA